MKFPSFLAPVILSVAGLSLVGFAAWTWFQNQSALPRFRGEPAHGTFYRILPEFTCGGGRRVAQSIIDVDESGYIATTTNPLDCSRARFEISREMIEQIGFDRSHLIFEGGIYERLESEPNLMESIPRTGETWCRPEEERDALDLYVRADVTSHQLVLQRARKLEDGTFRVEPPQASSVEKALSAGRLSYVGSETSLVVSLDSKDRRQKGRWKTKENEVILACRTSILVKDLCPATFMRVPPVSGLTTKAICVSRTRVDCAKLGVGFDPIREEERQALRVAKQDADGAGVCVFHPEPEPLISIFPASFAPTEVSEEALPIEVGIRFSSSKRGLARAVRFFRSSRDPSGYTVHLWSEAGQELATATGSGGVVPGWQEIPLAQPVVVEPGVVYVASYYTSIGRVSLVPGGLSNEVSRGLGLKALRGGGVFITNGGFPRQPLSGASNPAVDVVLEPM